jgi:ABC-type uncharacterized transport system involved in gliding motility auxiliary subunit
VARPALTARSQWLRVLLALPALIGIFFLGQAILDGRAWRLDLTPEKRYTLSDHARKVLDDLDREVRILGFLRSQDPRNPAIRDLLRQVQVESPRVRVDVVDVNRSPALAREYGVDAYGALVVESEGRRRVFSNPREEILIAAVLQVTRQQRKTVAWVTGHGEGDLADTDRYRGYASARAFLEQEYYEVVPVTLSEDVPVGTAVVVIAGPAKDFLPEELGVLDRYLQGPGNAMVLLDPLKAPGLAEWLGRYGLTLPADVVVDPDARLYGGEYLTMRIGVDRRAHPIVSPMEAPPLFSLTRSVGLPPDGTAGMSGVALLHTGDDSWATTDTRVMQEATGGTFLPGRDRRGPIVVGGEVAFLTPSGADEEARQGRIVTYGNAEFANNFFIEFLGNKDLLVNSVAWLARDPQTIGRRSSRQVPGMNQFFVSAEQGDVMFWSVAVGLPALFALVGAVLAVRRRWGT